MRQRISIALPTYNGADYIEQQLHSILDQTHEPDEIVITDDYSTDDTIPIVQDVASNTDVQIVVRQNERTLGVAGNYSRAIELCTHPIVFLCDQDDVWERTKIERMVEEHKETTASLLCHDATIASESLEPRGALWERSGFDPETARTNGSYLNYLATEENFVQGASIMAERRFLLECIPFPSHRYDYYLAVRAALADGVVPVSEELSTYRQHEYQDLGAPSSSLRGRIIRSLRQGGYQLQSDTYAIWRATESAVPEDIDDDTRELVDNRCRYDDLRLCAMNPSLPFQRRAEAILRNTVARRYWRFGDGVPTLGRDLISLVLE